jgi:hypothetical protein
MSLCRNWVPPPPPPQASVSPSPGSWGGHTRLWVRGWGEPKSDEGTEKLWLLYVYYNPSTISGIACLLIKRTYKIDRVWQRRKKVN